MMIWSILIWTKQRLTKKHDISKTNARTGAVVTEKTQKEFYNFIQQVTDIKLSKTDVGLNENYAYCIISYQKGGKMIENNVYRNFWRMSLDFTTLNSDFRKVWIYRAIILLRLHTFCQVGPTMLATFLRQ